MIEKQDIHKQLDFYKQIFHSVQQAVIVTDIDAKIILWNKFAEKLYGYSSDEAIGKTTIELISPEHLIEKHIDTVNQLKNGDIPPEEYKVKNKSGKEFIVKVNISNLYSNNELIALVGISEDITRQKEKEVQLKQNGEKYKLIAENTSDGILIIDAQGKVTFVSPSHCNQLGYTKNDELIKTVNDIYNEIHPEERDKVFDKINKSVDKQKDDLIYSYRVKHKNGHYIWREDHAKFTYDNNGNLLYTTLICRDITERKTTEQQINKFKRAIESSKASIVITDTEGNIEYANPYFTKRTGYTPDEYIGQNPRILKTDLHDKTYYENLWQTIKSGKTWEGEFCNKAKNGKTYWEQVVISPIKNEQNQIVNFVAVKTDISELKNVTTELVKAKEKAEESEFKVRSMFENTQIGILFCDTTGKILEANPAILDILGSPSLEASKRINLLTFKPLHEIGFAQNVRKCIAEKQIVTEDIVYTSKWGKTVFMKYYLVPVVVNEKVIGVWANLNNLTDLYKTQKELIAAKERAEESDRLKSAFLRNISHEIRTPMNAIMGFSNMLLKPNITHEKQQRFTDIIHKSINQLLNVVENTITISHIETNQLVLKRTEFSPNKLIAELFDDYKRYKNKIDKNHIELKINISENSELKIINDYTMIKQILNVLLDNAFKFTEKGKIEFGYTLQNQTINFYVSDTGIGIPKAKQKIIFKSFSQADDTIRQLFGGTGLGLSIAIGLIKIIGGQLTVNSEENKGTKIEFNLPIEKTVQSKSENTEKQLDRIEKTTLLVAEDEEFNFIYIEELLSETDLKLIHAINGNEAVEIFKNGKIDIILMDLKMPVMDGFEATKEIRKFNKQVPIIAQTAFSYKREDCINSGFTDYITKPFNDEQLIKMITQYVDK